MVSKNFSEWLQEGERLYADATKEVQSIEAQIAELESRLAGKKAEVNQIAQVIGKQPVEAARRMTLQPADDHGPNNNSPAVIARALTGRILNRTGT